MKKMMMVVVVTMALGPLASAQEVRFDQQLKNGDVINTIGSCAFAPREQITMITTSVIDQTPSESVAMSDETGCIELSLVGNIGEGQRVELTSDSHLLPVIEDVVLIGN
jgi:hypothetical protein